MHTPAYVRLPAAISDSSLKKGRTTYETFQTALDVQRMKRTTNEPVDSCSTQYEQACKKKKILKLRDPNIRALGVINAYS